MRRSPYNMPVSVEVYVTATTFALYNPTLDFDDRFLLLDSARQLAIHRVIMSVDC